MKKHALAASLLAFAMLAAGCSATTGASGSASSGGVIRYLHRLPDGEGMTKVNDIVARWNAAHPDMKVEATKFDGKAADMNVKLENDVKAGTGPAWPRSATPRSPSSTPPACSLTSPPRLRSTRSTSPRGRCR